MWTLNNRLLSSRQSHQGYWDDTAEIEGWVQGGSWILFLHFWLSPCQEIQNLRKWRFTAAGRIRESWNWLLVLNSFIYPTNSDCLLSSRHYDGPRDTLKWEPWLPPSGSLQLLETCSEEKGLDVMSMHHRETREPGEEKPGMKYFHQIPCPVDFHY